MNPLQLLKTLTKSGTTAPLGETAFRPGQIVFGKVVSLFPNQVAEVKIGSQKLIAKLEVPLAINDQYWFQVQQGEGEIHLKIAAQDSSNLSDKLPSDLLLKQLGIAATKESRMLLEYAVQNRLSISKEWLHLGTSWLRNLPDQAAGLETMKRMLEKDFPLTKTVFTALVSATNTEHIRSLMERLVDLVKTSTSQSELSGNLLAVLNNLLGKEEDLTSFQPSQPDWRNSEAVGRHLKQLMNTIGLNYESELIQKGNDIGKEADQSSLKPLLLKYLNENPTPEQKQAAEQLLSRITALQLLSSDNGVLQQFVAQIPLSFPQFTTEATIQWNGRKQADGKIDPNYCRILFYLELETIGDTIIDVQIQNRIMTLEIMNERTDLKEISSSLIHSLKDQLRRLDYHLSSYSFSVPSEKQVITENLKNLAIPAIHHTIRGVDLRI
ncbi:hypothetical protein ACQYAD_05665 [Neobacillus sp. SM06]|uniref:hypothetical protein n=1 Tax=Neobacillus sp. SM06 TaxID=3422492 RepID=UPI003D29DCFD